MYIQVYLQGYCKENEIVHLPTNENGSAPDLFYGEYIRDTQPEKYKEVDIMMTVHQYAYSESHKWWQRIDR